MSEYRFIKEARPQGSSDGFWSDIKEERIVPSDILEDWDQIKEVTNAAVVLERFEAAIEGAGLLNEF